MVVRNRMVTRIIAVFIGFQFVASSIPANALALKAPTARANGRTVLDVVDSMDQTQKDGGTRSINAILTLANAVSLRKGPRTSGYNVGHAKADKANGAIFNHSEWRAEMENKMQNLLMAIRDLDNQKASVKTKMDVWKKTLQTENLPDDVIDELTKTVLTDFLYHPRNKAAIETTARTLVNKVVNANLKKWIAEGSFDQTVLCIGETLEQYNAGRTKEIIRQDLQEILEGITPAQAKSIGLRIAYEPRWAINTGLTPTNEAIQTNHRYIKQVVKPLIDAIEVDYGGSLNPDNAPEILALPDVNGGLIGGKAKDPVSLEKIIDVAVKVYDGVLADGKKKGMILNIGGNWKAENEETKLADFEKFAAMLKTKDMTKVRVAFGTPRVAAIQPATAELNAYLAKSSPAAEALVSALANNLGDEAKRAEALSKIEAVSQGVKDFADLFLIKGTGQVDAEQLAALKSRIRKEKDPEIAPKRVAIYGSDSVARLAAREITTNGYDNLELVALIGKPNEEIFPFIVRDSQQGVFPGRAEAPNNDFMYLGNQLEAVRVLSDNEFVNVVDNLPWKALALDAIILDKGTFGKLSAAQMAKLEGIQLVVSRAAGEGFVTYIPGLSDEAEVQKEARLSAAASDSTAVTMAVETMKSFGEIEIVTTDVIESGKGQVPSTYRIESAYQTAISLVDRFKSFLTKMGFTDDQQTGTYQLQTQVSHGQLVMVGVVMKTENLDKKQVLAAFSKLANENEAIGVPEKWVKMTSNIVWGEKRAFFSPDDLYIKTFPGGSYVSMLFLVDEDTANVDAILRAIAGKSSTKQAVAKAAEAQYAVSDILAKLKAEKAAKDAADKASKAERSSVRVAAVKKAKKQALAHPTKISADTIKTLFGEEVQGVEVLRAADNKPVGLIAVDGSTIKAVNLLTPKKLEDTQATMAKYYIALRSEAMSYAFLSAESGNDGIIDVLDVYRPEAQLRVRLSVSAYDPKITTFKAVEELTKGVWKGISEPNSEIDPAEFAGKMVMAINGAGGNIGSAELQHLSGTDRNNIRVIAIGGPESDLLGAFYLRRDYMHGPFQGTIETGKDWIELNGKRSIIFSSRDSKAFREPENYPWGAFIFAGVPVTLVSDATGNFLTEKGLNLHRQAGALRAYATAPGDKADAAIFNTATFVMNRNEGNYDPNKHYVGSNASCTTGNIGNMNAGVKNGLAKALGLIPPDILEKANALVESARQYFTGTTKTLGYAFWSDIVQTTRKSMVVIQKKVGFNMFGYTDHALTDEDVGPDKPAALKKQSRARGASENIFPTTTGFKDAIGQVDVGVDADGLAIRFPTDVGSLGFGTYFLEGTISKEDILWGLYLHAAVSKGVTIAHIPTSGQIKVDPELRTNMAVISPDLLEVKHFVNAQGKPMTMAKLNGWYQNVFYYALEIADFYDKVIGAKEGPAVVAMKADGRLSMGVVKTAQVPLITEVDRLSLKGAKVLLRIDGNISDKKGNIKNEKNVRRLINEVPNIKYIMDSGVDYMVIETHNNKPKGKVVAAFSMKKPSEKLQELLGPDYKVVFHEGSINEQGVAAGTRQKMVKGAINVVENTRYCPGDETNDSVFSNDLAALVDYDMFVFDGFGAGERVHASTAGVAVRMKRIAIGMLVDQEISTMAGVLKDLVLIGIGGGPKLEEKIPALENGVENLQPGGGVVPGSAPSVSFYNALYNIEFGQKPSAENVKAAGRIAERLKAKERALFLPVDFTGTTVDLDAKVPGTDKTWLEAKTFKVYNLRLDVKNKKFIDMDTGAEMETKDVFVYDAQQDYAAIVNSLPKGGSVVWNGAMGVSEIPQFAQGTRDFANALAKVSKNADNPEGVFTDIVGDDTALAVDEAGVGDKMSFVSTGGGASLGLLAGKKLKAIQALEQIQGNIVTAGNIDIEPAEFVSLRAAGEIVSAARVGSFVTDYTKGVRAFLRNSDVLKSSRALILGPTFFRDATSLDAARNIASLSKVGIKVAIYGENGKADRLQDIVGNNDIIVGTSKDNVVAELMAIGIKPDQIMEVVPSEKKSAAEALVEAVTKLIGAKEVNDLFAGFASGMASLTKDVSEEVRKAETQFAAIMDQV